MNKYNVLKCKKGIGIFIFDIYPITPKFQFLLQFWIFKICYPLIFTFHIILLRYGSQQVHFYPLNIGWQLTPLIDYIRCSNTSMYGLIYVI